MANAKDTPSKGSKAAAKAPARKGTKKGDGESTTGAPRPRKWDYGIKEDATIVFQKPEEGKEPKLRGTTADAYSIVSTAKGGKILVRDFYQAKGTRHDLRVLCRGGHIKIVHSNGDEYPRPYVAPEPKADNKAA